MRVKLVSIETVAQLQSYEQIVEAAALGLTPDHIYPRGKRTTVKLWVYVLSDGPAHHQTLGLDGQPGDETRLGEEFDL